MIAGLCELRWANDERMTHFSYQMIRPKDRNMVRVVRTNQLTLEKIPPGFGVRYVSLVQLGD